MVMDYGAESRRGGGGVNRPLNRFRLITVWLAALCLALTALPAGAADSGRSANKEAVGTIDLSGSGGQSGQVKPGGQSGQAAPGQPTDDQLPRVALEPQPVTKPAWGFRFQLPRGWQGRAGDKGAILGHNRVAGAILVWPHQLANLAQLQAQMLQGVTDGGLSLRPSGQIARAGRGVLRTEYTGLADGQAVRAVGYGVLLPTGGGAYVVALTTPDKFGPELRAAAKALAGSVKSTAGNQADLVRHFSGVWVTTSTNTMRQVVLRPNGTFSDNYESSYGGQFNDQSGAQTGSWGHAGQSREQGRWRVQGDRRRGVIIFIDPGGETTTVKYQVHVEKGRTYWSEYIFNGRLYAKQR